jgi:lipopolysaccharide transport system permease protein
MTTASIRAATTDLVRIVMDHRKILRATTLVELRKKYAGSALGLSWLVLQPLLFLLVYMFLFMVVFRVRFPGMSDLGYVAYVFTGLVPYLAFSESLSSGAVSLRQNMHMVRNVIVPMELIPVRTVFIAVIIQVVGLAVTAVLLALDGSLSAWALALPLAMAIQLIFLIGLVLIVAPLGVLLPDIAHGLNILLIFLLFLSPIGFRVEQLPPAAQPFILLNPLYYMLETFRSFLIAGYEIKTAVIVAFALLAIATLGLGALLFKRLKPVVVDFD